MKVLEESLSLLKQLGICSDRLNVSTNEFLQSINGIIYFACFVGPLMISSAIFIYKNLSDLETSTNAMLVLTAGSASFGGFLTLDRGMDYGAKKLFPGSTLADDKLFSRFLPS